VRVLGLVEDHETKEGIIGKNAISHDPGEWFQRCIFKG
jgi:hypothetical protein